MKKILLFLILTLQCLAVHAGNGITTLTSRHLLNPTNVTNNHANLNTRAVDTEDSWIPIGKGFWKDGHLIWKETEEAATDSVIVEKSKNNPYLYRVWPFQELEGNPYQGYVIIHCQGSQKVYFEPLILNIDSKEVILTQAVRENGTYIDNQSWYGTLLDGVVNIPLTNFLLRMNGEEYFFNPTDMAYSLTMPQGYDNPINTESGVYLGLISFSDDVKKKPISLLNETTCDDFTSFVNNITIGTFTHLYDAVDQAIDDLTNQHYPEDLSDVILITFTDGTDIGSTYGSDFLYDIDYADYLANKIKETKIQGIPLEAYSIGLMSKDVFDEDMFIYNLTSLASQDSQNETSSNHVNHVANVNAMEEVENQLSRIYEKINLQLNHRELTLIIAGFSHNTRMRFTLDGIGIDGDPSASKIWFEGTFNAIDGVLENVEYHGFTSTTPSIIGLPGSKIKPGGLDVVISDCRDTNGGLLDVAKEKIDHWIYVPSKNGYRMNSEFIKDTDIKIEDIKSSVAVMLALDASKSLENSEQGNLLPLVKSSANSFINLLAGKPKPSGIADFTIQDKTEIDLTDPEIDIYNIQGIRVKEPTSGLFIYRKGNTMKKVLLK